MNSPSPFDPNVPQMPNNTPVLSGEEKQWAMFAHLATFAGFALPFGNVLGPLAVWLIKRDSSAFVNDQGKEVVNFQISMCIYLLAAALSAFVLIGFVLFPLVALADLILTVIGAIKASNGETYRYPATIRFIQ